MNVYATLDDLKALLKVTTAQDNAQLLRLLTAASRQIEQPKLAGRYFYCYEGTRYFAGGPKQLWLPDDILSVTTLKCDFDGDGTYEVTMATTDYHLYPLNSYPKILLMVNSHGNYSSFAPGQPKGVEIAGIFGWADNATPLIEKTALAGALGASETEVEVDSGAVVKVGQTIRVNAEQMFVEDIVQNKLYVKRPVNGTTAATHSQTDPVSVYDYPEDITHAVLIAAMRAWKRKDSAYQDVVGSPETGQVITSKGIDPDVAELVAPYRRQQYA